MTVYSERPAAIPAGSRAERLTSFRPADFPAPTRALEEWRFTPLSRFRPLLDEASFVEPCDSQVTLDLPPGADAAITTGPMAGQAGAPGDRAAVVAWNAAKDTTVLTIAQGQRLAEAATVGVRGGGLDRPCARHLLIRAEAGSSATVVLEYAGPALLSETVEIVVDDGADLTIVTVQDWEAGSVHAASHRAVVGAEARLKHICVTLGGDAVRITPDAEFRGEGGEVEFVGLYFADAGQHLEHRLFVDHNQPRCKSRVTYKGALQGQDAHAVWVGDVLIQAHAEGTDTYELNRNLVLTKGARADSVPNLEIETGEIEGAGHASATGRFDDEQLFYLMSRGVPEDEARRLVVRGFFGELIDQIEVPAVRARLIAAIDGELELTMGVSS
ncbi:MAG: Fe-S cluster assembly protein SufD [Promicromonosporaceae bacterium]|nr:Fe-S cluster assembly protein SufD [Promicromonosporaceae bacterium]